jgi:hypothetical protein
MNVSAAKGPRLGFICDFETTRHGYRSPLQTTEYSVNENKVGSDAVQGMPSHGYQWVCTPGQPEQRWMIAEVTPS